MPDRATLRLWLLRLFSAIPTARATAPKPGLWTPRRILLIRPDHVGDLLFATPALRLLRDSLPDAHLTALVGPWGQAVWQGNPCLDEILVCRFPGFARRPKESLLAPYRQLWVTARQLRSEPFDLALVLRFDHWWGAWLAKLAGIPERVGYDIRECLPFLTRVLHYEDQRHEVVQNLVLAQEVVRQTGHEPGDTRNELEFALAQPDREYVDRLLAERGVTPTQPLVAIHPGAGAPVKLWSVEKWARTADALVKEWNTSVVITGGQGELDLAWAVCAWMRERAIVAAGLTSLGQLAALFARCNLVLGPDCGPLHLAATVGVPTVHLYGPVDAAKFGPWGNAQRHIVVVSQRSCIPCNRLDYRDDELPQHPCVREIEPDAVLEAARKALTS